MRPTFSIIFFTTASGAGYGLLALAALLGGLGLLPPDRWFGGVTLALGLVLVTAGLLSSTFHLGHPERAWRALSQWRSSWLSREGVAAIAAYPPLLLFAFGWTVLGQNGGAWGALGWLGALLAALTVLCTGQIYATLRAVPEWHHPWVTPNYLLLALAGGAVWLNAIAHLFAAAGPTLNGLAAITIALAWAGKQQYWRSIRRAPATATAESATGLGGIGKVRLLEPPHTGDNYLLHEMGFQVARRHAERLRLIATGAGFVLPFALIVAAIWLSPPLAGAVALLAALSVSLGLVIERWLFFAEARHAVQLYYGASAV
jgi:sulfite dehydrogenase (quinone) subunit SoeC